MPAAPGAVQANSLIDALPRRDRRRVVGLCREVEIDPGSILCESGRPARHAYFPLSGFISIVTCRDPRPALQVGLVGNEGVLGGQLALSVSESPLRGIVQGSGIALRMPAAALRRELRASPALSRLMHRYAAVMIAQLGQTVACARFHEIEPRLARWLLMTQDRAHRPHFHLTHQRLAEMLGVRRGSVTIAAGMLQARKLISYARGDINVLDRQGLEAVSCECYARMISTYEQLIG
jgi:CRP-like cAMP-binding protein